MNLVDNIRESMDRSINLNVNVVATVSLQEQNRPIGNICKSRRVVAKNSGRPPIPLAQVVWHT